MTVFNTYSTGTAGVVNGSTVVNGAGTLWSGINVRPGDDLELDGHTVIILDVLSTTSLQISPWPYASVPVSASPASPYKIIQRSPLRFVGGQAMADVDTLIASLSNPVFSGLVTAAIIAGGALAASTLTLESTSGAGTTDAIIMKTGSQVERLRIDTSGKVTIGGDVVFPMLIGGSAASSTLTLESTSGVGTTDAIIFKTGSQVERLRVGTDGEITQTSVSAGTDGAVFSQYQNSASPALADKIAMWRFYGNDSAANKTLYAELSAQILQTTNGTEYGCIRGQVMVAGAMSDATLGAETFLLGYCNPASTNFEYVFRGPSGKTTYMYLESFDGGAIGPSYNLWHKSGSPATNDITGYIAFDGQDSAANYQNYAYIESVITSPTSTSESARFSFYVASAGALTERLRLLGATNQVALMGDAELLFHGTDPNHGIHYETTFDGLQYNGYAGHRWFSSTGPLVERMRLDITGAFYLPSIGTTASAANVFVNNASSPANSFLRVTSSLRYKDNVEPLNMDDARAALELKPIWYRSKAVSDNPDWSYYGLGAEDVAEVNPRLVQWTYADADRNDDHTLKSGAKLIPDAVMYDRVAILQIAALKDRIEKLENQLGGRT